MGHSPLVSEEQAGDGASGSRCPGNRSSMEAHEAAVQSGRPLPRTGTSRRAAPCNGYSVVSAGAPGGHELAAQTELLDQRAVAVDVGLGQVVEQSATATDEQEQTTT